MNPTLNLAEMLLDRGRLLDAVGRVQDASHVYSRLVSLRDLPRRTAEAAAVELAEIEMGRQQYSKARRHLGAALEYAPENARYHHLLAKAIDLDEDGDPAQALDHYRRSLELEPDQPHCLVDFGLLALILGQTRDGLQALRRAVELRPDDPEIVGRLVEGLCEENRYDEAKLTVRAALFRNPRHAGFRKLWSDFRFQQTVRAQDARRRADRNGVASTEIPVLLPFVRIARDTAAAPFKKRVRRDQASPPPPPRGPRRTVLPDRKHG